MRLILAASVATLVLAGCSRTEEYTTETTTTEAPAAAAAYYADMPVTADAAAMAPAAPAASGSGKILGSFSLNQIDASPAPAMIAYQYGYSLSAPQAQVRGMMARHEALCRKAGAAICQVISSQISERGDARLDARLELRAAPAWVATFRSGLAEDAAKSDGRIIDSSVQSEDLSRTIIDTSARLRAQTTLRDRLQTLLDTRPGKLADLIEIERELARVQGEIDAAQSQLAHDKGRVATSTINLEYEARNALGRDSVWSPLAEAFGDFVGLIIGVLAFLIRAIAVLLPLAAIVCLLIFVFRKPLARWRETRRQKRSQKLALRKAHGALTRRRPAV